ncbi:DMT family transporter [Halanaerocella petrolearia]
MNEEKIGYLLVVCTMLIWGSIGIIVRLIPYVSQLIVFYRVLFAFLFLVGFVFLQKKELELDKLKSHKWILFSSGVALALNWIFFFQAVKVTTIANATLSYYTAPIIVTILSVLFLKEDLTSRGIVALVLSFLGIGIMFSQGGHNLEFSSWQGIGYGLVAAFFYAIFTVVNKFITEIKSYLLTLVQTGVTMVILLPIIWNYQQPDKESLLLLIILGVIHTALALVLYLKGLKLSKVQDVGVLSYLDPVSAILLAFIFLGEVPTGVTLLGGSLILVGSYLVVSD